MDPFKIGKCGLYCGACPFYCATHDSEVRKKLEKAWGEYNDDWYCRGCGDENEKSSCHGCEILACLEEKKLQHCADCTEKECQKLQNFDTDDACHHKTARANRERIQEIGCEAWYKEQVVRWKCPSCGTYFMWYTQKCPQCGENVKDCQES
jgi:hypothetical protein